jgi:hypothetical protein
MSNLVERRINTQYIIDLNEFCDGDKDISACRDKLIDEMFRHEWFIALFKEGLPFSELTMLNKPFFRNALKLIYLEARDFIDRFKFLGYYFVQDIDGWVNSVTQSRKQKTVLQLRSQVISGPVTTPFVDNLFMEEEESTSTTTTEEEDEWEEDEEDYNREVRENILNNLPFGVIPVGRNEQESYGYFAEVENTDTMQKTLVFNCTNEFLSQKYHYRVMNMGAKFHYLYNCGFGTPQLIPISPFAVLREDKERIEEAIETLYDANSMNTYPENFMIAKPQPDAKVDDVVEDNLYAFDTLLGAKQADNIERQDLAMENARCQVQRIAMKRTIGYLGRCGAGGPVQVNSTLIWDRKRKYNRPSVNEAMKYIPNSVEITPPRPSQPLVNVGELIRKYENDVCTVMNLPYVFFKPHSHAFDMTGNKKSRLSSMGNTTQNDMYQKLLESEVRNQQTLFNTIFRELYERTFERLDRQVFRAHPYPELFDGVKAAIQFNNEVVKSDQALTDLLKFYDKNLVAAELIQPLIHKSFGLALPNAGARKTTTPLPVPLMLQSTNET